MLFWYSLSLKGLIVSCHPAEKLNLWVAVEMRVGTCQSVNTFLTPSQAQRFFQICITGGVLSFNLCHPHPDTIYGLNGGTDEFIGLLAPGFHLRPYMVAQGARLLLTA